MMEQTKDTEIPSEINTFTRKIVKYGKASRRNYGGITRFIGILGLILVVLTALVYGYLIATGVNPSWAIGTSKWIAPPGSTLGGEHIGCKNIDECKKVIEKLANEVENLRIIIGENPSDKNLEYADIPISTSTVSVENPVVVSASEFGLSMDRKSIERDISMLNSSSSNLLTIGRRIMQWKNPPRFPINLKLDEEKAKKFLTGIKRKVDREPIESKISFAEKRIIPSREGIKVDIDGTLSGIPLTIEKIESIPIKLKVERIPPKVTQNDFIGIDLETPLASYTTKFSPAKVNRSKNIGMVAAHFEGVVIRPGEIFSFNKVTGPRTSNEGYLPAPMFRNRRIELSPAGGACQVSTTLYNAALLAGFEIIERHPHSRPCPYVPYGQDAAVAYDSNIDLKFKNTLKNAVILHQKVDIKGGKIVFEIYGNPEDRVKVLIKNSYSWIKRLDSSTQYIIDPSLPPGKEIVEDEGCNGIIQKVWRVWYDEQGYEVRTEELSSDRLAPLGKIIRHNPSVDSSSQPSGEIQNAPEVTDDSSSDSDENELHGIF